MDDPTFEAVARACGGQGTTWRAKALRAEGRESEAIDEVIASGGRRMALLTLILCVNLVLLGLTLTGSHLDHYPDWLVVVGRISGVLLPLIFVALVGWQAAGLHFARSLRAQIEQRSGGSPASDDEGDRSLPAHGRS
ncbi:hypothetical protein [Engelhardtia mirabilis]